MGSHGAGRVRRGGLTQPVHRGDVSACQVTKEGGEVLLATVAGDAQEGGFLFFAQKHQALFPRLRKTSAENSQRVPIP